MTTPPPNLRQLLLDCRLGNETAARELWQSLYHQLCACAGAILRDDHLARDAVQNAFLKLLRTPKRTIRTINHPRAWMLTVTRNEALQLRRAHQRVHARQHQGDIPLTSADPPATPTRPSLATLINSLPDDAREIITLRHACGLSFDQASLVLNENRNTLAARYRRALEQLRDHHAPSTEATHHA